MTPVPASAPADWRAWALDVQNRLQQIEVPQGPTLLWNCLQAALPPAAEQLYRVVWVSDLGVGAVSNGTVWLRLDTGAAI